MTQREAGDRPAVSVILPTFNAAGYLGAAIASALGQSFPDFELLVLDNASTDRTAQVVGAFHDPRLRYLRYEENVGFVGNAVRGLALFRGRHVSFLGADDIWEPDFLRRSVAVMEADCRLSLVHAAATWIDEQGTPYGRSPAGWHAVTPGPEAFLDCFRIGFCFSALLMRGAAVRRLGPADTSWGDIVDSWLFLRLCLEGDAGYIDEPLARYRVHERSLSLALYRDGEMFRQHLRAADAAFSWPESRARGLGARRRAGLRAVAAQSIRILHLIRVSGSRASYLRSLGAIVARVPEIALYPATWARVLIGLLPRAVIVALRGRRAARARRRLGADRGAGDPS